MPVIPDSTSFFDESRQLPQHQALLALVRQVVDDPSIHSYRWLDLGCGQGQAIAQTADNLSVQARAKISYYGIDGRLEYAQGCATRAKALGMRSVNCVQGFLEESSTLLHAGADFELVTLVNTVHELDAWTLPRLLVEGISRLSPTGIFYAYDMQALEPNELGAITWSHTEVREILDSLLKQFGTGDYRPHVARWRHSRTDGWSVEVQRRLLSVAADELPGCAARALSEAGAKIGELIERKYFVCKAVLDSMMEGGGRQPNELETKERALYDFYALTRARERLHP